MNLAQWSWVWGVDHLYAARWQARHFLSPAAPERYSAGERQPVLLLPGVYEPWEFLRPVGDLLNSLGHPVHLLRELGYNRRPIVATADAAEAYLVAHDLREVVIIGHSKGGLVGKQLMVTPGVGARIDRMVAINSPFSGSRFARYVPSPTLRAFSPKDATLLALKANLEANARITSIYSAFDPIILEKSRLEGATNVELPLSGHFRPLGQRMLLDAVRRAVESPSEGRSEAAE